MEVSINLSGLTNPQRKLYECKKRFTISCWGRQSGKTTMGLTRMIYRPFQGRPNGIYWYVLQTHSAAEVAFNRYWDMVRGSRILAEKPNESEKFVTLINGAKVFFKSGENYEDLRVETLDGCAIDEFRQQSPYLWPKVIRPMLARHEGWADILSTPNGFEHFYDMYQTAERDNEWAAFQAPSTEAPWWTPQEIASARSTMSEDEFAQEILAEFREMGVGKVYTNHSARNQVRENPFAISGQKWSPYLPIILGADFNVGMMCWVLGQAKGPNVYYGEELAMPNTNTQEAAQVLAQKLQGHAPGLVIVGDASGKARKTASSGETDYSILMKVLKMNGVTNVRNLTPDSNPLVKDRVNIMNAALKDANGQVHLFYNPVTCPKLKRDFERVLWKQGTGDAIFDKSDPMLTHASDAAGYPVVFYCNEFRQRAGKLHVLLRQ